MTTAPVERTAGTRRPTWTATRAALAGWVGARVVVLAVLALSLVLAGHVTGHRHQGLLGWDAAYYRDIAARGYSALPREALRFYPLVPLVVRALGLGHLAGPVLLVVVQVAALGYGLLLVRLVRAEGWGEGAAARSGWLVALAPPAYVLVMGYAEAVSGLLAVGVFLGLRSRRWWLAAACGVLAGLARPSGLLLVVPALVEAARGPRDRLVARLAAVLAPAAGAGGYLWWASVHDGQLLAPLRIQQSAALHGSTSNPLAVLGHAVSGLLHGHVGTGLHVPWLVLLAALVVVMVRTMPASYSAWSALTLLSVLVGSNLDSSERYCWGAFPFVVAAARLAGRSLLARLLLVVSTVLLAGYALLAFLGVAVP